jgi:hypothetical protein
MSAWPAVVARLVAYLPTLPGWSGVTVYDGPVTSQDYPADFVTVGYVRGEDFGGSFEQVRGIGEMTEESGTVRCELVSQTGDTDIAAVRARVFALFDAWQDYVYADPRLGVLGVSSTSSLAADVQPVQNTSGAAQRLTVTLSYLARY